MTLPLCDQVTERTALGEPLAELSEHAATCPRCQRLVSMPSQLGAAHHAVDPGLGFSARMTVGAQHLLTVRRRRRLAAGLAATVASGAFGVFLVTRSPEDRPMAKALATDLRGSGDRANEADRDPPTAVDDDDLAAIVSLADVDQSMRLSARWTEIKKPLAPYRKLLKGETP